MTRPASWRFPGRSLRTRLLSFSCPLPRSPNLTVLVNRKEEETRLQLYKREGESFSRRALVIGYTYNGKKDKVNRFRGYR